MQGFAKDNPQALDSVLKQAFPGADSAKLAELRQQAADGNLQMPANTSFVNPETLNGAAAAYSPDNKGTILLSESLKSDPEGLRKAYAEEMGHHFDQQVSNKDSQGDEGQIFQEGLDNKGAISEDRVKALRAENDKGTAEVDGQQKPVENSRPDTPDFSSMSQEDLSKLAMTGDPQALNYLGQQYSEAAHDHTQNARASELQEMLSNAQQEGYKQDKEFLSDDFYSSIADTIGKHGTQELLQAATEFGNDHVINELRTMAGSQERFDSNRSPAAETLSYAGDKLKGSDYSLLLNTKTPMRNSNAVKAFKQALDGKNQDARQALNGALNKGGERGGAASGVYARMTEHVGAGEVQSLSRLANNKDDTFGHGDAERALQRAAGAGRPGAEEAAKNFSVDKDQRELGQLDQLSQKAMAGDKDALAEYREKLKSDSYQPSNHLDEKFKQGNLWGIDASRGIDKVRFNRDRMLDTVEDQYRKTPDAKLAHHVLENSEDQKLATGALKQVQESAGQGNDRALESLAWTNSHQAEYENDNDWRHQVSTQAGDSLSELAANGNAQKVTDTMLAVNSERQSTQDTYSNEDLVGKNTHSDFYRTLGESAGYLDNDNKSASKASDVLLEQVTKPRAYRNESNNKREGSLEGLSHLTGHLNQEQTSQLRDFAQTEDGKLGVEATRQTVESSYKFDQDTQNGMMRPLIDSLHGASNQNDFAKVSELKEYLTPGDMTKLTDGSQHSSYGKSARHNFASGLLADDDVSNEAKNALAKGLIESGGSQLSQGAKDNLVDFAAMSPDIKMRDQIRESVLKQPPALERAFADFGEKFSGDLLKVSQQALKDRKPGDPMYQLGELMKAQQLGLKGDFKGTVDQEKLAQRIDALVKGNPGLQKELESLRVKSLSDWRGSREGHEATASQQEWLKSKDFQDHIRMMSPEDQNKFIDSELLKMHALDPARVKDLAKNIQTQRIERAYDRPLENISLLEPEKQRQVLTDAFKAAKVDELLKGGIGGTKSQIKNVKELVDGILGGKPGTRNKMIQAVRSKLGSSGLHNLDGRMSAALGALGIASLGTDLANGKLPSNFDEILATSGNIAGIASAAPGASKFASKTAFKLSQYASQKGLGKASEQLLRASAKLRGTSVFLKGALKNAPLVGDVIGGLADANSAYKSFGKGDILKGSAYTGAAAIGLGVAAYSLAFGPPGWIVAGAAAVSSVGLSVLGSNLDGSDEKFLKRMRAFTPAAAAHYAMDGYGTNTGQLMRALSGHSQDEMKTIREDYERINGRDLSNDVGWDTSGKYQTFLQKLTEGYDPDPSTEAGQQRLARTQSAKLLKAMDRYWTDKGPMIDILASSSPTMLKAINEQMLTQKGKKGLAQWVRDSSSGQLQRALLTQLATAGLR